MRTVGKWCVSKAARAGLWRRMEHVNRSDSQLDVLGVVHYIVAGFLGLFGLLPLLHVAMGAALLSGRFPFGGTANTPPGFPAAFGWFFIVFGLLFICVAEAMALTLAFAGTYLRQRRRWLFCVVIDAITCALFPFGTVLGVVSLVTLSQPEVKARFL